jgi:hypothetical protein
MNSHVNFYPLTDFDETQYIALTIYESVILWATLFQGLNEHA